MKKTLKITLISLGSLLGLVLLTVAVTCWLILTPARLTSMVRSYAPNFISCGFDIERADLTIIKSFPDVGISIDKLTLLNPMEGSPSDTLAYIDECVVSVNIKKLLFENHIIVDRCRLDGGYVNLFTDGKGSSNYDIFPASTETQTTEETAFLYDIDLSQLVLGDVAVVYTDIRQGTTARLRGMTLSAKGNMKTNSIAGDMEMLVDNIYYKQQTDSTTMTVSLDAFKADGNASIEDDDIKADIDISSSALLYNSEEMSARLAAMDLRYKGDIDDYDAVRGNAEAKFDDIVVVMDGTTYLDHADVNIIMPLDATLSTMDIELGKSQIALNDMFIDFIGKVAMPENGDISVSLDLNTNTLMVEELIELIPAPMREDMLAGIEVRGELQLDAKVEGSYNETSMPKVDANITYSKGFVAMPATLPYPVSNINTSIRLDADLNSKSDVYINTLRADMSKSSFYLSGTVKDVTDKVYCSLRLKAEALLDELKPFIPEDIVAEGTVDVDVTAAFNMEQIAAMDLMKAKIDGDITWNDMKLVYCDTVNVEADKLDIAFTLPNKASQDLSNSLAAVNISGDILDAKVSDMITASLNGYNIEAQISNILNDTEPMSIYADFGIDRVEALADDMSVFANKPSGSVAMFSQNDSDDASYIATYSGDSLSFVMGDDISFATETLGFNVTADYDSDADDLLMQWNPHAGINLSNAVVTTAEIPVPVYIPSIDFRYDSIGIEINNSSIVLGASDFELQGKLSMVDEFLRKEDLLRGELNFTSHYTDVNQFMEIFNGMGDTTSVAEDAVLGEAAIDTVKKEDEPFMVPLGIDITLNTNIEKAIAGSMNLANVGGSLTVKDGVLVLEEMGFTSDAATMMVTAMYKSPRKNHLYLGLDLHLLEIDIAEMINIMPELDTILPMLSSFAGDAEFHFAIETFLKSNYDIKVSTLRGACAIEGKDLTVLDNATFRKLARMLNFKDKKHNKIDNLSVEITAFKNEIDVYPTLITLDKYQAVVGGRHNLDMTFDYRLGLSNPWIFRRFGILIGGDMDKMRYSFTFKKNIDLADPKGKGERARVAEETLRLKSIISDALKDNVKR